MANLIKKISVKNVCGKPQQSLIGQDKDGKDIIGFIEKDIMQVVGVAMGTRSGSTQYGDFVGLRGQFQATDLETGKVYRSSQCFLPDDVTDMIAAQLLSEGVKSVEFAFNIGIKPRDDLSLGYEYTAKPLLEPSENDPLKAVMMKLEGPKEAAKPEAAKPATNGNAAKGAKK